jgi:hypothetical protein
VRADGTPGKAETRRRDRGRSSSPG